MKAKALGRDMPAEIGGHHRAVVKEQGHGEAGYRPHQRRAVEDFQIIGLGGLDERYIDQYPTIAAAYSGAPQSSEQHVAPWLRHRS